MQNEGQQAGGAPQRPALRMLKGDLYAAIKCEKVAQYFLAQGASPATKGLAIAAVAISHLTVLVSLTFCVFDLPGHVLAAQATLRLVVALLLCMALHP